MVFEGKTCPERAYHAAVCLGFGESDPHLFVTGGLGSGEEILRDAWMLDVKLRKWEEVRDGSSYSSCIYIYRSSLMHARVYHR